MPLCRTRRSEKIADEVFEETAVWQLRPVEALYPVIYLDAIVMKIRDGHQVKNKAARFALTGKVERVKTAELRPLPWMRAEENSWNVEAAQACAPEP